MPLTKLRSAAAAGCLAVATILGAAACGPSPDDAPPTSASPDMTIEMTGTGGVAPTFSYPIPLVLDSSKVEVAWEGSGDLVVPGQPVLLRVYSENGADGTAIRNDFASLPVPYTFTPESIGSELFGAIDGHRVGSRIMVAAQAEGGPVVSSIDILPARAVGEVRDIGAELPAVTHDANGRPTVTIPEGVEPPATSVVQQVVLGTGDQVGVGEKVLIQLMTVRWSTGEVIESTWDEGRLPTVVSVGVDQLVEGVERGLEDLPVGSQVMLVVPPGMAFGLTGNDLSTETLVYVVDILAVSPQA